MDIKALCTICGHNFAEIVCDNCGMYVCREDFDNKMKICRACAKGLVQKK